MGQFPSASLNSAPGNIYFKQIDKEYFILLPEDEALKPIEFSKSDLDDSYILTTDIINDIFLNYTKITQENSKYSVMQKIIMPNFAQCISTSNNDYLLVNRLMHTINSASKTFLTKNEQLMTKIHFLKKPKFDSTPTFSNKLEFDTIESFHQIVQTNLYSLKTYSFQLHKSNPYDSSKLYELLDNQPTSTLIVDSFFWSIFTSDIHLLLKSLYSLFNYLESNSKNASILNSTIPTFSNDENQSYIRITPEMVIKYINYNHSRFEFPDRFFINFAGILASTPTNLFVTNSLRDSDKMRRFIKVDLFDNLDSNKFKEFPVVSSRLLTKLDYFLLNVDGDILIIDNKGNCKLFNLENDTTVEIKQPIFQKSIKPPFISDGHNIYAIRYDTVDAFILKDKKTLLYERSIQLRWKPDDPRNEAHELVFDFGLMIESCFLTNGEILQSITAEFADGDQISHFCRVFSLKTGLHIQDFHFNLPFRIDAICFEPVSKDLWALSLHADACAMIKMKYNGREAFHLFDINESTQIQSIRLSNIFQFRNYIFDFLYSIYLPYFGCEIESIDNFFVQKAQSIDISITLSMFEKRKKDLKLVQFLFTVLSFQLQVFKLNDENSEILFNLMKEYIRIDSLRSFLFVFIIRIAVNLKPSIVSKYFDLIWSMTNSKLYETTLALILTRFGKSKNFPYIFGKSNQKVIKSIISKIAKQSFKKIELNFLIEFQSSLFRITSIVKDKNKITIQTLVVDHIHTMFEACKSILSSKTTINDFNKSILISIIRKMLVLMKLVQFDISFIENILTELTNFAVFLFDSPLFGMSQTNPFLQFFANVFSLIIFNFNQMISFSSNEVLDKYKPFLVIKPVKSIKMINNNQNELFEKLYNKVCNVINKKLVKENKEIAQLLFAAFVYQLNLNDKLIEYQNDENAISEDLRNVIHSTAQIIRYIKSKELTNEEIREKSEFLLKSNISSVTLDNLHEFFSSSFKMSTLLEIQQKIDDFKHNFTLFFKQATTLFNQDKMPNSFLYQFLMNITYDELIQNQVKEIDAEVALGFITQILDEFGEMPPNATLSFISLVLLMLGDSQHDLIFRLISLIIGKLVDTTKDTDQIIFMSNLCFICHFIQILHDQNAFKLTENENKQLSQKFQEIDLLSSMSFELEHSMIVAGFSSNTYRNIIDEMISLIPESQFHSYSLLIYDKLVYLLNENQFEQFEMQIHKLLKIIGTLFSGRQSEFILKIAIDMDQIEKIKDEALCKTPISQISCALDLIQVIRRLSFEKRDKMQIKKIFEKICSELNLQNEDNTIELFGVFVTMTNSLETIRPHTIATTNEKKSYYVLSYNEIDSTLIGIQLPIYSNENFIIQTLFITNSNIKIREVIQYDRSLFDNFTVPLKFYHDALEMPITNSVEALFIFYALNSLKENLASDTNLLKEFTKISIDEINFRLYQPIIFELIKKLLQTPNDKGVFELPNQELRFNHVSYNQIVFHDDFQITSEIIKTNEKPNVFVTSILSSEQPSFLNVNFNQLTSEQLAVVGIVTLEIEPNQCNFFTFTQNQNIIEINSETIKIFETKGNSISICFDPLKHLAIFSNSEGKYSIFLGEKVSKYIFLVYLEPNECIEYDFNVNSDLLNYTHIDFSVLDQQTIKSLFEIRDGSYDNTPSDDIVEFASETPTVLYVESFGVIDTPYFFQFYPDFSFESSLEVLSSPKELKKWILVSSLTGQITMIDNAEEACIKSNDLICPFDVEDYEFVPVDLINDNLCQLTNVVRKEALTYIFIQQIINDSNNISQIFQENEISEQMIVNLMTSLLLMLEPITPSKILEMKSPIDFNYNGFEHCQKIELYDSFSCLISLFDYYNDNQRKTSFIFTWFDILIKDFTNKYNHFSSIENPKLKVLVNQVKKPITGIFVEDAIGYIIFCYAFGLKSISLGQQYGNYVYHNSNSFEFHPENFARNSYNMSYGILPIFPYTTENLFNTFYQLAISFKYFVLFSASVLNPDQKSAIMKMVFDSVHAKSPFFFSHREDIFEFIDQNIYPSFTKEYIKNLNFFQQHNVDIFGSNEMYGFRKFLTNQKLLFKLTKVKDLNYFIDLNLQKPSEIELPEKIIPDTVSLPGPKDLFHKILIALRPLKEGSPMPVPYLLSDWLHSFLRLPPVEFEVINDNILSVNFLNYTPKTFCIHCKEMESSEQVLVSLENNPSHKVMHSISAVEIDIPDEIELKQTKVFLEFQQPIKTHRFIIYTKFTFNESWMNEIAFSLRNYFIHDMNEWYNSFSISDDQQILSKIKSKQFSQPTIKTRLGCSVLFHITIPFQSLHMISMRGKYLKTLNYLYDDSENSVKSEYQRYFSFYKACRSFSNLIQVDQNLFGNHVLFINRQLGYDVRNGYSDNIDNSMIGQFTSYYIKNPTFFINPFSFSIQFTKEEGVGVGLLREFAGEIIKDINCEKVGLFIMTPNGRNHEGRFQEMLVPCPSLYVKKAVLSKLWTYYRGVGTLIAIAIKGELRQPDLMLPPLFWNFLKNDKIQIEDIFDIDIVYKNFVDNLLKAAQSMSEDEFEDKIKDVSPFDIHGVPFSIDDFGQLTRNKVRKYIAMCNEYRLNELRAPLLNIRIGFWTAINVDPIPNYITPYLLEYLACGEKTIDIDDLKSVTNISGINDQQQSFFWQVVERMSNDERRKLLQFTTGLSTISQMNIRPAKKRKDESLPSSATCFYTLYLPEYSSADIMYQQILTAINETGSFETV